MNEALINANNSDQTSSALAETILKSYVIKGGVMGNNGTLLIDMIVKPNKTSTKFLANYVKFGGQLIATSYVGTSTVQNVAWIHIMIQNRGSPSSQFATLGSTGGDFAADGVVGSSGSSESATTLTVDTTQDQTFTFSVKVGSSSDTYEVIAFLVRVLA